MLNPTEANDIIAEFQKIKPDSLTVDEKFTVVKAYSDFAETIKGIVDAHSKKAPASENELMKVFLEAFAKSFANGLVKGTDNAED